MRKFRSPALLLLLSIGLTCLCLVRPRFISDTNKFLENFVNHEFLATLGVIVTITLASCANLHLEINKLQEITGAEFAKARKSVRLSAYTLLWSLGVGFVLVICKPVLVLELGGGSEWFNAAAIVLFFANLSILVDITKTVFKIPVTTNVRTVRAPAPRERSEPKLR